jgi:hypothetical protein
MTDERARRVVRNEALFRQVNETVEGLNEVMRYSGAFAVVCECGELSCNEQIHVEKAAYERTRSNPVWFMVKQGHEIPDVEHIVDTGEGYVIVEKDPPEARAFARKTAQ